MEITLERVEEIRDSAGLQQLEQEFANLELKAADSSFWDDRDKAQEALVALTDVKDKIRVLMEFKTQVYKSSKSMLLYCHCFQCHGLSMKHYMLMSLCVFTCPS